MRSGRDSEADRPAKALAEQKSPNLEPLNADGFTPPKGEGRSFSSLAPYFSNPTLSCSAFLLFSSSATYQPALPSTYSTGEPGEALTRIEQLEEQVDRLKKRLRKIEDET